MFRKILIANRGEIAVRIAQTARQMGVAVAAVYSEPDRDALHVRVADEVWPLAGRSSAETYLRGERVIEIARSCGAEAIHPGYGFLSENAEFAEQCAAAGIVFIGPSPAAIRAMGDKIVAKEAATRAGVPVVPGWSPPANASIDEIARHAAEIGYPVLIKAAAGGGGKGMRVVEKPTDLPAGVEAARREAQAAFGDARIFAEKYIANPRHVEVQVFGDGRGNVVHLFERECSIQRRHQKIIEESPSPALSPQLRDKITSAAVRLAQAVGYANAGTVEFMVDPQGAFYFLEMNTRLQVEHPVTELVTGCDLVRAQLEVAAGGALPFKQDDLRQDGHAIECRIYAEDAARGFLPSTGTIAAFAAPLGPGVRVDGGVADGSRVETYYDPMLAKLIVWGRSRPEALARMGDALRRFVVLGVTTNIEFLQGVVAHPEFAAGRTDTHFLERHRIEVGGEIRPEAYLAAALASRTMPVGDSGGRPARVQSPWELAGAWRGTGGKACPT